MKKTTKKLLKIFIRDYEHPDRPEVRGRVGHLAGVMGIVCNLLLSAAKLLAGALSGAVAIIADGMNSLSDAVSSVVTLVGFRLAERPADENHPYGHARFEYLSGLTVAAMMLIIGFELARTSVQRIFRPEPVEFTWVEALILLGSVGVKRWLAGFHGSLGRYIDSAALKAAAADSRSDVIATTAVLVSALIASVTRWQVDGVMGLGVAGFILCNGVEMAKETVSPLLGESADPVLQQKITDLLRADPMVLGYHDLMVHDYGPGQRFASVHVEMDHREDVLVCHGHIDNLERDCLRRLQTHLVIHYDPVVVGDPETERLRQKVLGLLEGIDPRLTIHDFRVVVSQSHTNLVFDMAVPEDLWEERKEIREKLETGFSGEKMQYYLVITYDSQAFNNQSWGF